MTTKSKKTRRTTVSLAAHEMVALAAFLAGADRVATDTEDIAKKAEEIAPGRFTWRKYKDQISLEDVYKHLWALTSPEKGGYVTGSKKEGWLLTEAGVAFAEKHVGDPTLAASRERRPYQEEKWIKRERARMLGEVAYQKMVEGRLSEVSTKEAERFFRIDDYVLGAARRDKLTRIVSAFRDDPDLCSVVKGLADLVPQK